MKISFSKPKGMDTILTIDNNEYRIEGFLDNLGAWISNAVESAIILKEDFMFSNLRYDLKLRLIMKKR